MNTICWLWAYCHSSSDAVCPSFAVNICMVGGHIRHWSSHNRPADKLDILVLLEWVRCDGTVDLVHGCYGGNVEKGALILVASLLWKVNKMLPSYHFWLSSLALIASLNINTLKKQKQLQQSHASSIDSKYWGNENRKLYIYITGVSLFILINSMINR